MKLLEVLTGLVSGIVSGTGMGGGTILILVLSLFMGIEQHIAQATNLVFFIPTSIVAIIYNRKMIKWKIALIVTMSGIIGAIIGASIATKMNVMTLKKCFGIFLAMIAIHEIYSLAKLYIFNRKRHNKN